MPSTPRALISPLPVCTAPGCALSFYYNGYGIGWGDYREVNEPNHESVCAFEQSSYTYSLYQLGTDPQAVCQATIQPPKVWAFCATMFDNTGSLQWGAAYSGQHRISSSPPLPPSPFILLSLIHSAWMLLVLCRRLHGDHWAAVH